MKKLRSAHVRPKPRNSAARVLHDPAFRSRLVETKITKANIRRKGRLRRQLVAAADLSVGFTESSCLSSDGQSAGFIGRMSVVRIHQAVPTWV